MNFLLPAQNILGVPLSAPNDPEQIQKGAQTNDDGGETDLKKAPFAPQSKKSGKKGGDKSKKEVKVSYGHRWLLTTLKGHSGSVLNLDFSGNGKYLASCADDRAILLWTTKTFPNKDGIKSTRVNVEYDYATRVCWSPDCKALLVSQATGNAIQVYKVTRKEDNTFGKCSVLLTFPKKHSADILAIGISCNGKFIMSCSSDTSLVIWDLKGEILATIDTHQVSNSYACLSPCGRFVASCGFTPDVKVWEVSFGKGGDFKEVKRAFELKGHKAGVLSFAFSSNSTRMASVSKDGTWKLWDTDIDYSRGQEPYLLTTGALTSPVTSCLLDLSPDGRTVAIASVYDLSIYSGLNGELQEHFQDVLTDGVTSLRFSPNGKYLLIGGGKQIRVFVSIPGFQNALKDLEEKKKAAANASLKNRLQSQIQDTKSAMDSALEELKK